MRVAVLQPPYPAEGSLISAERCIDWMRLKLAELRTGEHDFVLLPEYANAPGLNERDLMRQFVDGQGSQFLRDVAAAARHLSCNIALGSVMQSGEQWFNRSIVYSASGESVFNYDKIHLTDAEQDGLGFTPGTTVDIFEWNGTRICFATCFDIYFSAFFDVIAEQVVDLVLCPSYQRSEDAERIIFLSQARAFDSGVYLVRSSYAMGDESFGGQSLVVTPGGTVIANAGSSPAVISSVFNPEEKFLKPASHGCSPVEHRSLINAHRRPDIYGRYLM